MRGVGGAGHGRVLGVEVLHGREAEMFVDGSDVESQLCTGGIGLRIPAELEQLPMLRAVAETVLLTADFTLDVVTDVRVALDEVATALILSAAPGREIDCDFRYDLRQVEVQVTTVVQTDEALRENSFGRHLLDTLTDSIRTVYSPFDTELRGYPVVVDFSRSRNVDADR
ncbi:anti-sigma factor [Nocardia sp. NPDC088792]|uniref:anti-sigma factor n=1 Tax=Nocardia sp. NPDC088792 TaxID=3364332 RepID=UPI0037F53748